MLNLNKIFRKTSVQCFRSPIFKYYSSINNKDVKPSYYKILDVNENATVAEIKAAFHKKAKEHHPDTQNTNDQQAKLSEEKFKQAVEAYKTLSDESKRKEYDESIKSNKSSNTANSTSKEGTRASYTRYSNEKFYGDTHFYDSTQGGPQYNRWQNDGPPPPPPEWANARKGKAYWRSMDYETVLIWGLIGAVMFRWMLFVFDSSDFRQKKYSEEEKLDPSTAEAEGIYVEVKVPKDQSKPLSIKDCQGLSIEQLEELDRMGYRLPDSVKEEIMDFRESHRVYKKPQGNTYWNFNAKYNAPANISHEDNRDISTTDFDEKDKYQDIDAAPKVQKKRKTWKEAGDEVKKDIIGNSSNHNQGQPKQDIDFPEIEGKTKGASEVKIPRMKANLYNLERNG